MNTKKTAKDIWSLNRIFSVMCYGLQITNLLSICQGVLYTPIGRGDPAAVAEG